MTVADDKSLPAAMAPSTAGAGPAQPDRGAYGAGFAGAFRQLGILLSALRRSRFFRSCTLLALGIGVVICLNMVGQVQLNAWKGALFNALEQRLVDELLFQCLVFLVIVAALLVLVVGETWFRELLEVRLREWLTNDLLDQWVVRKRPYLLAFAGDIGVNPDQRLQADALHLTELSINLSIGLLRSSLALVSFLGVLWILSAEAVFTFGAEQIRIPGYLVWCALVYAIVGSWLTWRVGRPLIGINAERYAREAELRFALVRISENAEAIALYGGEGDERRTLDRPVDAVVAITRRLANALARLTWITSGYGWLGLIVPVLVASPGYFQGSLSFGGLMMAVDAFNRVQSALDWFVDRFPGIADWRATLLRVASLRETLPALDALVDAGGQINYVQHRGGQVVFADFRAALADGEVVLDEPWVELQPGERLLITGPRGVGKSVIFKAMAGIWPWGGGTIHVPPRHEIMFIPQRPYLPLASLRAAITYPNFIEHVAGDGVKAALERTGLGHLAPLLDEDRRWDQELTLEEQQRLVVARLLLRRPRAVFMDEALSALEADRRKFMVSIFEKELAQTILVSIASGPPDDTFYNRTVLLRRLRGERRVHPAVPIPGASPGTRSIDQARPQADPVDPDPVDPDPVDPDSVDPDSGEDVRRA